MERYCCGKFPTLGMGISFQIGSEMGIKFETKKGMAMGIICWEWEGMRVFLLISSVCVCVCV